MSIRRRTTLLGAGALLAAGATRVRAGDTLKIGVVLPLTGPAAESGQLKRNGIQLALEAVNAQGGVLGRKLEIIVEDDQTTNPGAVLAFSRLAGRDDIAAFIGPIRSTQVNSIAPDVLKAGRVMMFGGTDPTLTHSGNPWLFRCRPHDVYSAQVIAQFGVDELKKQKWAVVFSTDAFGTNGSKALTAALARKGVQPVLVQGYTNQQADFTPVVVAIRQSGADLLSTYFTFENDLGLFARQVRQLGVRLPWVGSPTTVNTTALNLAGPALYGTYAVTDYAADSSPAARAYADQYQAAYKSPPDFHSSNAFDAVNLLAMAITTARSTNPQAMRKAIIAIKGYQGTEGEYNYDENGDGLHGYNIVRNENGRIVFDRHIELPAA